MTYGVKYYRKKTKQAMKPWTKDIDMTYVSISKPDKLNGSPKKGDMIAVNENDCQDRWLVAEKFFKDNYEAV